MGGGPGATAGGGGVGAGAGGAECGARLVVVARPRCEELVGAIAGTVIAPDASEFRAAQLTRPQEDGEDPASARGVPPRTVRDVVMDVSGLPRNQAYDLVRLLADDAGS